MTSSQSSSSVLWILTIWIITIISMQWEVLCFILCVWHLVVNLCNLSKCMESCHIWMNRHVGGVSNVVKRSWDGLPERVYRTSGNEKSVSCVCERRRRSSCTVNKPWIVHYSPALSFAVFSCCELWHLTQIRFQFKDVLF